MDVAFFSSDCTPLGRTEATPGGGEVGLPAGVRYVLVTPRSSAGSEVGILVFSVA